ncbi:MAG TPA: thioesterase [Micromonospora sp.]
MNPTIETGLKSLVESTTTAMVRPRYEGCNIGTWIGFKHNNFLVEEAVLEHFRSAGLSSRRLYEEFGLGLDLVSIDTRIQTSLHLDDLVTATVVPTTRDGDDRFGFKVTLTVDRDGTPTKAISSKVAVQLRIDDVFPGAEAPAPLAPYSVHRIGGADTAPVTTPARAGRLDDGDRGRGDSGADDPVMAQLLAGRNAVGWKWRIPYFYVHFTRRMQMNGYLRHMEEVVDRFLAERGISIRTMLDQRAWIPAATHSKIELVEEAHMEEDLYTVYAVEDIFKDLLYRSRMETYVVRDGVPVLTSQGEITHGYAVIEGRDDWRLVSFDDAVQQAFRGTPVTP